jgi:hypothetical protein
VLIFGGLFAETLFANAISAGSAEIFSWIFIWTGVEKLIFDRREVQYRVKLLKRIFHAKYILVRMTNKRTQVKETSSE